MTAPVHVVVPGPIDQRTGGTIYDRRIVLGVREQGRPVTVHELEGAFPFADTRARAAARRSLEAMRGGLPVIDGLALPAFSELPLPPRWVALVHHPLALETGLSGPEAAALAGIERALLPQATRVVVTSPSTRRELAAYGVADQRIGVVLPGTEPAPLARGSAGPEVALLCIASLTPRKGHLTLLDALARVAGPPWQLTCVGSLERDPAMARAVVRRVQALGLEERVELVGERPEGELGPFYDGADLFVLPSHHEGYGMALAEALARGLPVVSTTAGAIPDTVPAGAGLLVPPGDAAALGDALGRVLADAALRARLAAGARAARVHLPDWSQAARRFAAEVDRAA